MMDDFEDGVISLITNQIKYPYVRTNDEGG